MIHFDGINWIAVILAVVASMALGAAWYMVLAKQWIAATGKTQEQLMGSGGSATPFIIAAICQLVMAYFIALLTPMMMDGVTSVYTAILVGVHLWFGFILTSMIINHRYQNMSWNLTLIDGGYLLGVVAVQGLVIGLFG
ncbi:MAG: DUF1761 domain-containing protein [Hyphomicrobiaceae bacterium]|nr:DUF1761 domain-containing protein [Hyphomicrobiaceae bacterium]MCC0024986.1 DUF1761 domain-containing protein [Hyphomicrobiaceae bacterium]